VIYNGIVIMGYNSPNGLIGMESERFTQASCSTNPAYIYSQTTGIDRVVAKFKEVALEKIIAVTDIYDRNLLLFATVEYEACGNTPCLK
jgi:hypothetical protein